MKEPYTSLTSSPTSSPRCARLRCRALFAFGESRKVPSHGPADAGHDARRIFGLCFMNTKQNETRYDHINSVRWRGRVDRLPVWLRRVLTRPPRRGEGLHGWLFSTA